MAEYIDRDAVLQELKKMSRVKTNVKGEHTISDYFSRVATLLIADSYIRNIPAADVQPVKHGRWISDCCSDCGISKYNFISFNIVGENEYARPFGTWLYCPRCGAKMDAED